MEHPHKPNIAKKNNSRQPRVKIVPDRGSLLQHQNYIYFPPVGLHVPSFYFPPWCLHFCHSPHPPLRVHRPLLPSLVPYVVVHKNPSVMSYLIGLIILNRLHNHDTPIDQSNSATWRLASLCPSILLSPRCAIAIWPLQPLALEQQGSTYFPTPWRLASSTNIVLCVNSPPPIF